MAHIPSREVERFEFCAAEEQIIHSGDSPCVPAREVECNEARAVLEHTCHVGDALGVDIVQVHARAVSEAKEQVGAVAGEAHLVGGGDARDRRCIHIAAPLVVLVVLAPDECQLASGAVKGVVAF